MMRRFGLTCLLLALTILSACGAGILTPSHHITEEYSAAFAAASSGNLNALRADIDADPALIRATEWEHRTLLHDAVDKGHVEIAEYLIGVGVALEATTSDGQTALHMAAQHGDIPMIQMLLQHNANINPADRQGWTPLDRALKWGHADAAALLRAHGGQEGGAH